MQHPIHAQHSCNTLCLIYPSLTSASCNELACSFTSLTSIFNGTMHMFTTLAYCTEGLHFSAWCACTARVMVHVVGVCVCVCPRQFWHYRLWGDLWAIQAASEQRNLKKAIFQKRLCLGDTAWKQAIKTYTHWFIQLDGWTYWLYAKIRRVSTFITASFES